MLVVLSVSIAFIAAHQELPSGDVHHQWRF
jgi:hypothetical protein